MAAPVKKFPHVVEVAMTSEQLAHVERVATMSGQSRSAVIRYMVQDRLDIANGVYSPYPPWLATSLRKEARHA